MRTSRGAGAVVRVGCNSGCSASSNGAIGGGVCCKRLGCAEVDGPPCPPAVAAALATLAGQGIG